MGGIRTKLALCLIVYLVGFSTAVYTFTPTGEAGQATESPRVDYHSFLSKHTAVNHASLEQGLKRVFDYSNELGQKATQHIGNHLKTFVRDLKARKAAGQDS